MRSGSRRSPIPRSASPDEALVRVEASGICGSDLHIFHGRVPVEVGFTIGHEFVGTVLAAGDEVERVAEGDRVLGCFHTACGTCRACLRGDYNRCERGRIFGHGSKLGDLQGAQAELLLVPRADLTLRRVPEGVSDEVALFAGDVMGTGFHSIEHAGTRPGDTVAVLGLGPVGLCAVQAARGRRGRRRSSRSTRWRRGSRWRPSSAPCRSTSPRRTRNGRCGPRPRAAGSTSSSTRSATPARWRWRSAWPATPAPCRGSAPTPARARSRSGLAWLKGLTLRLGLANVIAHVDRVLALIEAGKLDPAPLVTHRMKLDEAAEAYRLYDNREALKIVLTP